MNVTDLYYSLTRPTKVDKFQFTLDSPNKIIGFLGCDKDFIPAVISDNVFTDIVTNNSVYQKCVYISGYKNNIQQLKNTLSGLMQMDNTQRQLFLYPLKINNVLYYRTSCMLLDKDLNILLSICYDFGHDYKLVVSPMIYCDKTVVNKYILQKIIPVFVQEGHEVTIKKAKVDVINNIEEGYLDRLKNMDNAYELIEMGH